jgi:tRNA dimethylallyltransferase
MRNKDRPKDVPVHLLDHFGELEDFSAFDFAILARQKIKEIHARGNVPIIEGGSSMYTSFIFNGPFESELIS